MGFAAAFAVIGLVAGVIQGQKAASAAKKRGRAQEAAAEKRFQAEEESRAINLATQKTQAAQDRKRAQRERRVRVASILQGAESAGAAGSSGAIGAVGALGSAFAGRAAQQQGAIRAAVGQSIAAQAAGQAGVDFTAASNIRASNTFGLISGAAGKLSGAFGTGGAFEDIFSTAAKVPTTSPNLQRGTGQF